MDLRVQKTLKSIFNAFIQLRSSKGLEQISVTELTKLAVVNKSTFYLHYKNVYELSDVIENELIQDVISTIPLHLDYFDNPYHFTDSIIKAFNEQGQIFRIIFSGSRYGVLADKVEMHILKHFNDMNPAINANPEFSIAISLLIQGGFCILNRSCQYETKVLEKSLCRISEQMVNIYKKQ